MRYPLILAAVLLLPQGIAGLRLLFAPKGAALGRDAA